MMARLLEVLTYSGEVDGQVLKRQSRFSDDA